jgi:hypothetical protein
MKAMSRPSGWWNGSGLRGNLARFFRILRDHRLQYLEVQCFLPYFVEPVLRIVILQKGDKTLEADNVVLVDIPSAQNSVQIHDISAQLHPQMSTCGLFFLLLTFLARCA